MQLSKVLIEAIDRICEDSIRHPCIPDNGIFVTDEARTSEDDHIADIAAFIAYMCAENSDIQNDLEVIVKELLKEIIAISGRVSLVGVSEGKAGPHINRGEDIALESSSEYGNRVHLD